MMSLRTLLALGMLATILLPAVSVPAHPGHAAPRIEILRPQAWGIYGGNTKIGDIPPNDQLRDLGGAAWSILGGKVSIRIYWECPNAHWKAIVAAYIAEWPSGLGVGPSYQGGGYYTGAQELGDWQPTTPGRFYIHASVTCVDGDPRTIDGSDGDSRMAIWWPTP